MGAVLPADQLAQINHQHLGALGLSMRQLAEEDPVPATLLGKPWTHVSPLQRAAHALRQLVALSFDNTSRLAKEFLGLQAAGALGSAQHTQFVTSATGGWF
jgi:hypothetical protein